MNKKKGISVCFIIKNGFINGYPFYESLESCLPIASEIVISEGFSSDGTYEAIQKFINSHPDKKIVLFRTNWEIVKSQHGEIISHISMEAMRRCSCEWIYYLQADEIIHEKNYEFIISLSENKFGVFNSVSFPFAHLIGSWTPLSKDVNVYHSAIRMVRNISSIKLLGDGWTFYGNINPTFGPDGVPERIFHLGWVFPKNIDQKAVEHAKIYQGMSEYQKNAEEAKKRISVGYSERKGFAPPEDFSYFPEKAKSLIGLFEYSLPENRG